MAPIEDDMRANGVDNVHLHNAMISPDYRVFVCEMERFLETGDMTDFVIDPQSQLEIFY